MLCSYAARWTEYVHHRRRRRGTTIFASQYPHKRDMIAISLDLKIASAVHTTCMDSRINQRGFRSGLEHCLRVPIYRPR